MRSPAAILICLLVLSGCATPQPAWRTVPPCPDALEGELPEPPTPEQVRAGRAAGPDPNERRPEITNRRAASMALERHYPRELKAAGEGGTVILRILIDHEGVVRDALVVESSRLPALDRAATVAIRDFLFAPAQLDGCRTPVWSQIPLTFVAPRPR